MSRRDPAARRAARIVAFLAGFASLTAWVPAGAHEGHEVPDTTVAGGAMNRARHRYVMPPPGEAMMKHVHNKVVHFPIALASAALLLLLADRREHGLGAAGMVLVWLAAAGGVVAYFAGRAQMEAFKGSGKEWLVGVHERWGTGAAVALVAWALLSLWPPMRRRLWIVGLLAVAIVLTAAYLGGLVAHGE